MVSTQNPINSLAIFCKVVDNYGDIGICWRLSRQLQQEHGIAVTLWVDDLRSFRRICPEVELDAERQQVAGVTVRHWTSQEDAFAVDDIPDIVIEFFGCDIPPGYAAAMAQREPRPVWFNLEGLSAEEWVEGCHALPSMHPRLPITKYFFFPGFTSKTGGLLHESAMEEERQRFLSDPAAVAAFLSRFGVMPVELASLRVSLFCYPHAPVSKLFDVWRQGDASVTCLVPEGVAADAVGAFLGADAKAGAVRTREALTVRVLPFVAQPDYDKLLWACDLNIVRGEDSFVRAQWAGKPFVWHIYPQDKDLHHVKLRAFLHRYAPDLEAYEAFSLCWNGASAQAPAVEDWAALWRPFHAGMPEMIDRAENWRAQMLANGDLASNLVAFAHTLRSSAGEKGI